MADSVSRDRVGQRTIRRLQYYLEKLELLENSVPVVASNRQIDTFALVNFFVFVVYSHRRHTKIGKTKYCLNYTLTWALPQQYFFSCYRLWKTLSHSPIRWTPSVRFSYTMSLSSYGTLFSQKFDVIEVAKNTNSVADHCCVPGRLVIIFSKLLRVH